MRHLRFVLWVGIACQLNSAWPARADVTIALVNENPTFNVTVADNYLYVTAVGGKLKSVTPIVLDLRSTGDEIPAPSDAITFDASTQIGNIWKIPVKINASFLPKAGQYHATVQISAESDGGAAINPLNKPIQLVRPPIEFQVGDGSKPQRMQLERQVPMWGDATGNAVFTLHPRTDAAAAPQIGSGDIYSTIGSNAYRIRAASLTGSVVSDDTSASAGGSAPKTQPSRLLVTASLPSNVQRASGKLYISGPQVKGGEAAVDFEITAKDMALWPLLTVLAGYFLAFWVGEWITRGRPLNLNRASIARAQNRLEDFLKLKSGLSDHPDVIAILNSLAEAERDNDLADFAAFQKAIASAESAIDQLIKSPPAAAQVQAVAPAPQVELLGSPAEHTLGRLLQFLVTNAPSAWTPETAIAWSISKDGGASEPFAATKGLPARANHRVRSVGSYTVTAIANNASVSSLPFTVAKDPSQSIVSRIVKLDIWIEVLAAAVAALLAYIAIDAVESFGSKQDYLLTFLGGFGINSTIKSIGGVLGRLRGGFSNS